MNNEHDFNSLTSDQIICFFNKNIEKLPLCYLLLSKVEVNNYNARISFNEYGRKKYNLGSFYKPITNSIND